MSRRRAAGAAASISSSRHVASTVELTPVLGEVEMEDDLTPTASSTTAAAPSQQTKRTKSSATTSSRQTTRRTARVIGARDEDSAFADVDESTQESNSRSLFPLTPDLANATDAAYDPAPKSRAASRKKKAAPTKAKSKKGGRRSNTTEVAVAATRGARFNAESLTVASPSSPSPLPSPLRGGVSQIKRIEADAKRLQSEHTKALLQLESKEDEIQALQADIEDKNTQLTQLQEASLHTTSNYETMKLQLKESKASNKDLQRRLSKSEEMVAQLHQSKETLEGDLAGAQETITSMTREHQAELEQLRGSVNIAHLNLENEYRKFQQLQQAGRRELDGIREELKREERRIELKRQRWNRTWNEQQPITLKKEAERHIEEEMQRRQQEEKETEMEIDAEEEKKYDNERPQESPKEKIVIRRRFAHHTHRGDASGVGGGGGIDQPASASAASIGMSATRSSPVRDGSRRAIRTVTSTASKRTPLRTSRALSSLEKLTPPRVSPVITPADAAAAAAATVGAVTTTTLTSSKKSRKRAAEKSINDPKETGHQQTATSTAAPPNTNNGKTKSGRKRQRLESPLV